MKSTPPSTLAFALYLLIALLAPIAIAPATARRIKAGTSVAAPARIVPSSQPAGARKGDELAALEQKLLGTWYGPDCGGDYTFNADGTFDLKHFTPGNYTLTGTWSIRWDALPPTLVVICKASDFRKRNPKAPEYDHLDKPVELKVVELNGDALALRLPDGRGVWHYSRKTDGGHSTPN